ncbi:alpha/beta fold hydrolase [Nonomuraea sp. NPDC049152]|uniref:alpha/beta fold hydrolase n=1 Tax=Nonomuraea sp. NPDC049152 TaxID=3154350 RepID=UPI0034025ECE
MQLKVHEWGPAGAGKLAILVHGVMSSAGTWCRVAPLLVERGYHVLAPDLRGHGDSAHAGSYRGEDFAADVVESLPAGADIVIGHSLGGRTLALAVDELRPARAVYSDPAWLLSGAKADVEMMAGFAHATKTATAEQIAQANPRWAPEDVAAELEGFAAWDLKVMEGVGAFGDLDLKPPAVPSLVQAADPSFLVSREYGRQLEELGYQVTFVANTGHCVHRDDLDGFMTSLDGWI